MPPKECATSTVGAKIVIESWRCHYNAIRPHASLRYRAPAPEVFVPALAAWPAAQLKANACIRQAQSSCAGHAPVAHETQPKLTSNPDHSLGADHSDRVAITTQPDALAAWILGVTAAETDDVKPAWSLP